MTAEYLVSRNPSFLLLDEEKLGHEQDQHTLRLSVSSTNHALQRLLTEKGYYPIARYEKFTDYEKKLYNQHRCAAFFRRDDGKVLVVGREDRDFFLPGGKVEKIGKQIIEGREIPIMEDPAAAMIREFGEEFKGISITLASLSPIGTFMQRLTDSWRRVDIFFVNSMEGSLDDLRLVDNMSYHWIDPRNPSVNLAPFYKDKIFPLLT